MIGLLRQRGLRKIDCIRVVQAAIGLSHGEAKRLVHHSPVWADRREADEAVEEMFWRALFISALVGEAEVTAPAEDVTECHERQQRARTQLHQAAAGLPDELLTRYRESMAENLLGRAFAALVAVGQQHGATEQCWHALAAVAETLCLNELLGEDEPGADAGDFLQAAYAVRQLAGPPG
ncbi:hypothetical protein C8D88_11921 [Lentzea atacamensis]|uniref:Uncharacterized protein n=1 Tax=Lentzea atacamensis TaxID=531938 RepID=A0A316HS22_9PSEU|nr:hypothetical protein [Lentzea atacamensis]PWK81112.1 hypothetical protein C8D88_11921 [Lentzea atacamensis]